MKLLVAGGAGYIGSVLVPRLLSRGYEVDVVDLLWFGNQLPAEAGVIRRDILELTEDDLRGYDQVIFLGGLSNDPMAEFSPALNYVHNAAAPATLAYLAKRAGVRRFVFGSSCSVYGFTKDEVWDESAPTEAIYPYGISKLQAEAGVRHLADDDFSVVILRKGTVSGWSPRMRLDLVVNTMFKTALLTNRITVNNPAIWRPILAIQDAATAYVRAVEVAEHVSGTFNVASRNVTLGALADHVADALREFIGLEPELDIRHNADVRNYKVSIQAARDTLGFTPSHDIRAIVRDLVDHRAAFGDLESPRYSNIATFRSLSAAELGVPTPGETRGGSVDPTVAPAIAA